MIVCILPEPARLYMKVGEVGMTQAIRTAQARNEIDRYLSHDTTMKRRKAYMNLDHPLP